MPIRTFRFVALAGLAGCLETASPPTTPPEPAPAPVQHPEPRARGDAFCDHRRYRCRPNDGGAQLICNEACLFPSHCQEYRPGDYQYCATHPDSFDLYHRYCDAWGNPDWDTHCVAGPVP